MSLSWEQLTRRVCLFLKVISPNFYRLTFIICDENSHDERGMTGWCLVFLQRAKRPGIASFDHTNTAFSYPERRRKFFFRRQSDSSLIVGRIVDPRPGLHALSMNPFVAHWCTIYPSLHVVPLPPRVERWTICFAICHSTDLQTCFSGSENPQELLLRVKTIIYHPNWRESG
jgi:hypothetical protein